MIYDNSLDLLTDASYPHLQLEVSVDQVGQPVLSWQAGGEELALTQIWGNGELYPVLQKIIKLYYIGDIFYSNNQCMDLVGACWQAADALVASLPPLRATVWAKEDYFPPRLPLL